MPVVTAKEGKQPSKEEQETPDDTPWINATTSTNPSTSPQHYQYTVIPYAWPVAGAVYVSWRVFWAARLPIMDCDEVYNYWEPLCFMLYGVGYQTWEYAHEYALRTYAYLWPLAKLVSWMSSIQMSTTLRGGLVPPILPLLADYVPVSSSATHTDRLVTFVLLKAILAGTMGVAEVLWCHALTTTRLHQRRHVGPYLAAVLGTAAGMNHAAAALLPSSTWMGAFFVTSTAFVYEFHYTFCTLAVTATLTIGWPFGVVLLIPLGLRILYKEWEKKRNAMGVLSLLAFTVGVTAVVQAAVMWIDYQYYGIWVSPTVNIFQYNAAAGGDELYGVEPTSYYVKNLLLNLNLVAPLGVIILPMIVFTQLREVDLVVLLCPLYLWLAITVPRPHKEERFLYPIYPLLCLGAVLTVDKIANFVGRIMSGLSRHKELMRGQRHAMHACVWTVVAMLALSRTWALYKYYSAPMHIFAALHNHPKEKDGSGTVCVCGEWYRFPSSFFLPPDTHLAFLESSFKGQLPQPFTKYGSRVESQQYLQPFNDQNKEESLRYVDTNSCDFIVDLQDGECAPPSAEIVESVAFLDSSRTSALHRILYIPHLHEHAVATGAVQYNQYILYKITRGEEEMM